MATDPVCGMTVDPANASTAERKGGFVSPTCQRGLPTRDRLRGPPSICLSNVSEPRLESDTNCGSRTTTGLRNVTINNKNKVHPTSAYFAQCME